MQGYTDPKNVLFHNRCNFIVRNKDYKTMPMISECAASNVLGFHTALLCSSGSIHYFTHNALQNDVVVPLFN